MSNAHWTHLSEARIQMNDATKILISPEISVREAIAVINSGGMQIALVVDDSHHLLGTVTDGDIRRALLKGLTLEHPVEQVFNREPFVVHANISQETVSQLMNLNRLRQIPVVDSEHRLVGIQLWKEFTGRQQRDNPMVIMAGGKGLRLRPHTEYCPKPMLPVAGKPILEHIIERGRNDGFGHFIVAIQHLGHIIEKYFGDGSRLGVKIDYLHETEPLGTAGALSLLPPPDSPILVTNGDVLTNIHYSDILDFHLNNSAMATMAVRQYEWQHPLGVVQADGIDLVGFEEKPVYRTQVNAGIYVLDPASLELLPKSERFDMPALFVKLKEAGLRTLVFPMHEVWLDVGKPEDYMYSETLEFLQSSTDSSQTESK